MTNLIAVVPIRHDKRNVAKFGNSDLITEKIKILKQVVSIDKIVIATDDDYIISIADSLDVDSYKRNDGGQPLSELVFDVCSELKSDNVMWTFVTCPFITPNTYESIIKKYSQCITSGYDSLLTVYPYKFYMLDKNGALNFRKGPNHVESKDLVDLYKLVNGVFIAPRMSMIEWRYFWGDIPYYYQLDEYQSLEVKTECDYKIAQIIKEYGGYV